MKSTLTKLTMGLLCVSLAAAPASAAIQRQKSKPATETTTTATHAIAAAGSAVNYSSHLSRAEKREARKALIKALRNHKAETNVVLEVILCFFIPPLAVFLHEGEINTKFWISLILTLLGGLPGVIYSLLVVLEVI